jgi:hypothetical protein
MALITLCALLRKLLSRAFSLVVRTATAINIGDIQAGLKAGNGDILRTIFKMITVRCYVFDVELLVIANLLNLSIKEVPIPAHCKREGTFAITTIIKVKKTRGKPINSKKSYENIIRHSNISLYNMLANMHTKQE